MNVIIIEDEPLAVRELESVLREVAPELRVVAVLESVQEGIAWLQQQQADLVFSDIHLGDGKSFEIFEQVAVKSPVIFITAYDEYALEAFKSQGIDYILKPFDKADIRKAVDKVKEWVGNRENRSAETYQQRFLVQAGNRMKSVPVEEIAYFMADGKYVLLFTEGGNSYIIDQTMGEVERRLDPALFFRLNRKFIVRFEAIREMVRYSGSRIRVVLSPLPPENVEVIVSAERIREFKEWLNQ